MLNVSEMSTITKELILKMEPSITTPEANKFRDAVAKELIEMRAQNIAVEIPYDFD